MEKHFADQLQAEIAEFGVHLSDRQIDQFYLYYEMMTQWNKVMNLTAITELGDVIKKHFADSLSLVRAVPDLENWNGNMIDVGTGAGFPGIPLKIAFPDIKIVLLDSLNKRVKFLNAVIEQIGFTGIETIHGRAEDFGRDAGHREQYDLCVSRAVANISALSEYCLPFVKIGGNFISYKSGNIDEELKIGKGAISELGGSLVKIERFLLAGSDAERTLVVIRKTKQTSKRYPRKAGIPLKNPIV